MTDLAKPPTPTTIVNPPVVVSSTISNAPPQASPRASPRSVSPAVRAPYYTSWVGLNPPTLLTPRLVSSRTVITPRQRNAITPGGNHRSLSTRHSTRGTTTFGNLVQTARDNNNSVSVSMTVGANREESANVTVATPYVVSGSMSTPYGGASSTLGANSKISPFYFSAAVPTLPSNVEICAKKRGEHAEF